MHGASLWRSSSQIFIAQILFDVSSCWQKNCNRKQEQENKQISQLFIFMLYFQSIVFRHVLCQRAERVQRPKLLLILERDNSERALWCQTVCFIKSTAWPHALNPLQCKLASLRKNTRQLLKFNVVSQYCTVTVLYCQLCLNLYIHAA